MNIFLLVLAVARVTWFITEDHLPLVAKPRDWVVNRNPGGSLAYLVNCWWCTSIYVAAGAAIFWHWALDEGTATQALMLWPALSFAAVACMSLVDVLQAHGSDD